MPPPCYTALTLAAEEATKLRESLWSKTLQDKKCKGQVKVAETCVINSSKIQEQWVITQPQAGWAPGTNLLPTFAQSAKALQIFYHGGE